MSSATQPQRRYDPLRDRWVLVSPQRDQRPWQGQLETVASAEPAYLPDCYLCPGNQRAEGACNPDYEGVFVFDNDFPALLPHADESSVSSDPLFLATGVSGRCRVICYSPRHDLTLAAMSESQLRAVIDTWAEETEALGKTYEHVQIFENRGAAMGCSNAHPHGQIWALDTQPTEVSIEDRTQADYLRRRQRPLLLDYAEQELARSERLVCHNEQWIAVVPWWATWPFEVLLLPLARVSRIPALDATQRDALAAILKQLLGAYERLFATPFPYSMGWHGAPASATAGHWQLHAHFYPPLLRSATVRKHMVGFEMLGESQRDLTPERAAEQLRRVVL
jgi:UDPglucose--hexose-1-phosphate uridylyltransferase